MKKVILTEKQIKEWARWYSENDPIHDPEHIADTIIQFAYKFGEVVD